MGRFVDWYDFLDYLEGKKEVGRYIYYRVEDEGSQAITRPRKGVSAPGRAKIDFDASDGRALRDLKRNVKNHIDWRSRYTSSLISTYDDAKVAFKEAERRMRCGRRNVTITVIDVRKVFWQVQYRNLRLLADRWSIRIPRKAWHNSEYEYIFLHYIPQRAVRDVICMEC
jgi:hypothetical protein